MPHRRLIRALPPLLLAAACADEPTATGREPEREPTPAPRVVGVYEFVITVPGDPQLNASVSAVPAPGSQTLTPSSTGLVFELLSAARMTHGTRGQGGQRYFTTTMRVRNGAGTALTNLTMIPVTSATTVGGSPFNYVRLTDGTNADTAVVNRIVPAGSVVIADDGSLRSTSPDVLQVFTESEVAAIPLPSGYTGIFPYGFVVRNPSTPGSRTLPATSDPDDYAGVFTISFRHPLQPSSSADPYTYSIIVLAVQDSETRLTETIEEGHDTTAVRQLRERAAALGATTVTVLAGSPALDPAVPDYPGQRQICSVRATGPAGAPRALITEPAGYAEILVLRPGESTHPCAANFRTGTPARPAVNVPFPLTLKAVDLYGNVSTAAADSIRLESVSGPAVTLGPRAGLASGQATIQATYTGYGTSLLRAVGRRNRGTESILVAGVTRTWTGNVSTDANAAANWNIGAPPGAQDTAYIPAGRPFYPVMVNSVTVGGLIVDNGATVSMGPYNLTVANNVWAGATGGVSSTTGLLILTGTGGTIRGTLPRMRITGSYSLNGDVNARSPLDVELGRLTDTGWVLNTRSF